MDRFYLVTRCVRSRRIRRASDDVGDDGELSLRPMIDSVAGRTRFFDYFLTAATDAGIRQMVILASMHRVEPGRR
jgi:O-methyltransferase involved in polyketide biosynthesis